MMHDDHARGVAVLDRSAHSQKTMSESRCDLSRVVWKADENMFGSGRGTLVLELVDDVAWATATRHAGGHAVTVAIDHMSFGGPTWPGDVVTATAQVEAVGTTSMSIGVYVVAQPGATGRLVPTLVAEAHLVFVAVDDTGSPRPVPAVVPETAEEHTRAAAAAARRSLRSALRATLRENR
ncbi:acyl-CoA thioesterase [Labedaea rhizosphaerae]|uniref:Acyl-CoA hydrolase n=1 Tax=Labedaea rhizosphaerae TaxID=598644 RepID=A0A4R6SCU4_LABRH|nr:hotdog domain-containing protein [Labedaea rhizosphaerae]TDP97750.1 acyl-CoA hydrolase [Labedaea rhizosphaerae]